MLDMCGMARRNKPLSDDEMLLRKKTFLLSHNSFLNLLGGNSHLIGLFLKTFCINLLTNCQGQSPSLQADGFSDSKETSQIL